jgi:carbon storage regulator
LSCDKRLEGLVRAKDHGRATQMLILSRAVNERIIIDGKIIVTIVRVEGKFVKVGIEAPSEVEIHRKEIFDEIQRTKTAKIVPASPGAILSSAPKSVQPPPSPPP